MDDIHVMQVRKPRYDVKNLGCFSKGNKATKFWERNSQEEFEDCLGASQDIREDHHLKSMVRQYQHPKWVYDGGIRHRKA
jgi:hypothetical protein